MSDIVYRIRELDPDIIAPSTKRMNVSEQGGSKIVFIGKPGCFERGTKILMYDGMLKNVEDVRVGDKVMGDDSSPRNVLELCHNFDEMFKMNPVRGESYVVNKQHILTLKNEQDHIIDITVEKFLEKDRAFRERYKWFRTAVEFPAQPLEKDPYTVGAWLGGGNPTSGHIEGEILDYNFLRKNNLLFNKHIPQHYKVNSRSNRLKLLAGILDTSNSSFVLENEKLLNDMVFVARSLGFNTKVEFEEKTNIYRCYISGGEEIPTKTKDIFDKRTQVKDGLVTGFTLESIGEGEYFGFCLDGNNRFLLGDFSVTHNSGKSFAISSLIYEKSHIFPVGLAMNGTEDSNHHYGGTADKPGMFPPAFVFNNLDLSKLEDIRKRQLAAKEHLPNPWAVVVIDDCMDEPKQFNNSIIQGWFKNGRHWKSLLILGLQYCMDVRPGVRSSIDGAFIFREPNIKFRKNIYENYCSIIPDYSTFEKLMDELTDDHTALYIHNNTTSNKIEDCVFWYKAKPVPANFRLGSQDFWDYNNERYNPDSK